MSMKTWRFRVLERNGGDIKTEYKAKVSTQANASEACLFNDFAGMFVWMRIKRARELLEVASLPRERFECDCSMGLYSLSAFA